MLKTGVRFLVITLIAVILGFLVYHLNQPVGTASFGSGIESFGHISGDFGGEGSFREGGLNVIGGLSGIAGNLLLVAIVTAIVVPLQKAFAHKPEVARTR